MSFDRYYNCKNKTEPTIFCTGTMLWLHGESIESQPHVEGCRRDEHAVDKINFREALKSKMSKGSKPQIVYQELASK